MADQTTSYSFNLPTVGGDSDLWGSFLNTNWETLDDLLSGTATLDGVTMVNATITATELNAAGGILTDIETVNGNIGADKVTVTNAISEGIQTVIGQTPTIDPKLGGTLCTWSLTANLAHSPTIQLNSGESITLIVESSGTSTIVWPSTDFVWLNLEPELAPNTTNVFEFFKVATITFGAFVGYRRP